MAQAINKAMQTYLKHFGIKTQIRLDPEHGECVFIRKCELRDPKQRVWVSIGNDGEFSQVMSEGGAEDEEGEVSYHDNETSNWGYILNNIGEVCLTAERVKEIDKMSD